MKISFNNKYIILLGITGVLSSCGVVKRYDPINLNQQQQEKLFRDHQANDSFDIKALHWRSMFTDPILQALIEEALNNNLDLQNAVLQMAQAEASFNQSRLMLFPSVNFAPQVSHNKTSKAALNLPSNVNIRLNTTTVQLGFSSNWELDVWGKLASARRAASANFWQANATKNAVQTVLIANLANMYYTLIALDEQLAITHATVALRDKTMATMKSLKDAAIVNGAAVVQSEANYYAAKVSIPDLEQAIREIENQMSVLLGRTPQEIFRNKSNKNVTFPSISAGVPVQLLVNRPDIIAAENSFRKAFEQTNFAKAQFYPSFTITSANAGISALTTKNLLSESIFYNFVGGLTAPIFNRGAIRTNHKIAVAQQQQAWNTFEKTLLIAGQEVSNALFAFEAGKQKMSARLNQISALEKAVHFNMQLLEYSSATNYTDVLTSEQSLLAAKLGLVNDKLQQNKAMIELYRALGGGWE